MASLVENETVVAYLESMKPTEEGGNDLLMAEDTEDDFS